MQRFRINTFLLAASIFGSAQRDSLRAYTHTQSVCEREDRLYCFWRDCKLGIRTSQRVPLGYRFIGIRKHACGQSSACVRLTGSCHDLHMLLQYIALPIFRSIVVSVAMLNKIQLHEHTKFCSRTDFELQIIAA